MIFYQFTNWRIMSISKHKEQTRATLKMMSLLSNFTKNIYFYV